MMDLPVLSQSRQNRRIVKPSSKWRGKSKGDDDAATLTPATKADDEGSRLSYNFVTPGSPSTTSSSSRLGKKPLRPRVCLPPRSLVVTPCCSGLKKDDDDDDDGLYVFQREGNLLSPNYGENGLRYQKLAPPEAATRWAAFLSQAASSPLATEVRLNDIAARLRRVRERPDMDLNAARRASCLAAAEALEPALARDHDDKNCGDLDVLCSTLLSALLPVLLDDDREDPLDDRDRFDGGLLFAPLAATKKPTANHHQRSSKPRFALDAIEPISTTFNTQPMADNEWSCRLTNSTEDGALSQRLASSINGHLSFEEHRWLSSSRGGRPSSSLRRRRQVADVDGVAPLLKCLADCVSRRYRRASTFLCPAAPIRCIHKLAEVPDDDDDLNGLPEKKGHLEALAAAAGACAAALLAQYHRDAYVANPMTVIDLALALAPVISKALNKLFLLPCLLPRKEERNEEAHADDDDPEKKKDPPVVPFPKKGRRVLVVERVLVARAAYDLCSAIATSLRATAARFRGSLSASSNLAFVRLCRVATEVAKYPFLKTVLEALAVGDVARRADAAAEKAEAKEPRRQQNEPTICAAAALEDPNLYKGLGDLRGACSRLRDLLSSEAEGEASLLAFGRGIHDYVGLAQASLATRTLRDAVALGLAKRRLRLAATMTSASPGGFLSDGRVASVTTSSDGSAPGGGATCCGLEATTLAFRPLHDVSDELLASLVDALENAIRSFDDLSRRNRLLRQIRGAGNAAAPLFVAVSLLGRPTAAGVLRASLRFAAEKAAAAKDAESSEEESTTTTTTTTVLGKRLVDASQSVYDVVEWEVAPELTSFAGGVLKVVAERVRQEVELAKLRRWHPILRDHDDVARLSYVLDANHETLRGELRDARRLQSRVADLNVVAPGVAKDVFSVQFLGKCLERALPTGLVVAAVERAQGADLDDLGIASLFDDEEEEGNVGPQVAAATSSAKWKKWERRAKMASVYEFYVRAFGDLVDRLVLVAEMAELLDRLEEKPTSLAMEMVATLRLLAQTKDRSAGVERAMCILLGAMDNNGLLRGNNVLSDASTPAFRKQVAATRAQVKRAEAHVNRLRRDIARELKRAGVKAEDRVRVGGVRRGLVIAELPENDAPNLSHDTNATTRDDFATWFASEDDDDLYDDDNDDPRPRQFTVAVDDLTASESSRYASWGRYNWDTGYWTVSRRHLEVIWDDNADNADNSSSSSPGATDSSSSSSSARQDSSSSSSPGGGKKTGKIGLKTVRDLEKRLAEAKVKAVEREGKELARTMDAARRDLAEYGPTDRWATEDLADAGTAELKRLVKKARAASEAKRREVRDLKDDVASLKVLVGASRSKVLSTADWKDPAAVESLRAEKVCLERDLEARERLFDDYAEDLAAHLAASQGVPPAEWLEKNSAEKNSLYGAPPLGRFLDRAALAKVDDNNGKKKKNGTTTAPQQRKNDDDDDDEAFVFPLSVLPPRLSTAPPSGTTTTTTTGATNDRPARFDDEFFNRIRERYVWWISTWVDVRRCETCWSACPAADLLGSAWALRRRRLGPSSSSLSDVCSHVALSCGICMAEYARSALGDSSVVSEHGLPCFESRSVGCRACYPPAWLGEMGILNVPEVTKMERFVRSARIRGGDKGWCPNADCDTVVDFGRFAAEGATPTCPKCAQTLCPSCRQAAHAGDCVSNVGAANLKLANDRKFQCCPRCFAVVEKAEACDHMSCKCGARFCYVCGALGHNCPTTCTKARHFNGGAATTLDAAPSPSVAPPEATTTTAARDTAHYGRPPNYEYVNEDPDDDDDDDDDYDVEDDEDESRYGEDEDSNYDY